MSVENIKGVTLFGGAIGGILGGMVINPPLSILLGVGMSGLCIHQNNN
jgi:hypothetical protein